jgi:threonine synthase
LCFAALRLFISEAEVPSTALRDITSSCFSRFGDTEVVKVSTIEMPVAGAGLENADWQACSANAVTKQKLAICELWHGPTLAFKDLGLQFLGALLQYFLSRSGNRLKLLVGTSGDTGSAAIEAVRGSNGNSNIDIVVLYPLGRCSEIQELQMTIAGEEENNCVVVGTEGTSDDLDRPMEAVFADTAFKKKHQIGSINSVNICRVMVQIVHYFYAYFRVCTRAEVAAGCKVRYTVPTGAAGHISAGMLARQMGLPVETFTAATNSNDIFHRIMSTGSSRGYNRETQVTPSPSMDIQVPYNIERMLHMATAGAAPARVKAWMKSLREEGELELPEDVLKAVAVRSVAVSDQETLHTIKQVYATTGYMLDPHTAVGVAATLSSPSPTAVSNNAKRTGGGGGGGGTAATVKNVHPAVVCMACAHPAKFGETVSKALGVPGPHAIPKLSLNPAHPVVRKVQGSSLVWRGLGF